MLVHRLQRAQIELQSHRCWLSAFIRQTRGYHRFETPTRHSLIRSNGFREHLRFRDGIQQATPSAIAFESGKARKPKKLGSHLRIDLETARQVEALVRALNESSWQDVRQAYRGCGNKQVIRHSKINQITQRMQTALRAAKWDQGPEERNTAASEIVEFAEELVDDIKSGAVTPSNQAHLRLLGIFKESGARDAGVTFWRWLESQNENFVDASVYGAAIELLAVHGTPLPELEELYQQALSRFPGTFAHYHLSPEAILEDRDRSTTLHGLPITLLQGILTARLLNGDSRGAYLALDAALRLYPDQTPPRFFTLFSQERPIVEAYTVLAMAWRAGILIPLGNMRYLLSALRSHTDGVSVKRHPMTVRAMLSVLYMHIGAGGLVTQNIINELVIAMTQFPRMEAVTSLGAKDKQRIMLAIIEAIRKCLAVFARFGAKPGLSAFNSLIINLGGYGHSKQIIGVALADMRALGLEPNEVTRCSILVAAGMLSDEDLVKKGWNHIVEARTAADEMPDSTEFHCLVKAAHLSGQIDFAREQFEVYKDRLSEGQREAIANGLEDGNTYNLGVMAAHEEIEVSALLDEIQKISADLDVIDERTKDVGKLQDYSDQKLPMRLLVEDEVKLPEADMSRIYDELTTEARPSQSSEPETEDVTADLNREISPSRSQPDVTPTNIPFGTIRYENWKLINWLLEQSEANDKAYRNVVDKAIAGGTAPPPRSKGLWPSIAYRDLESFGLSDLVPNGKTAENKQPAKEEEVRMAKEHILRLRGRVP